MTSSVPTGSSRGGARRAGLAQQHRGPGPGQDADRQVDEEDRPPAEAEQVRLGQQPAEQRSAHPAERERHAVDGERTRPLRRRELDLDEREHLGDHQRRHRALEGPRADQHGRALGGPGEHGGDREADQADEEHPLSAVDVAEAPPGDQQERERQGVGGNRPLQRGGAEVKGALDRGQRHQDHGGVQDVHERGHQGHRERRPATRVEPGRGGCRPLLGEIGCLCHLRCTSDGLCRGGRSDLHWAVFTHRVELVNHMFECFSLSVEQ